MSDLAPLIDVTGVRVLARRSSRGGGTSSRRGAAPSVSSRLSKSSVIRPPPMPPAGRLEQPLGERSEAGLIVPDQVGEGSGVAVLRFVQRTRYQRPRARSSSPDSAPRSTTLRPRRPFVAVGDHGEVEQDDRRLMGWATGLAHRPKPLLAGGEGRFLHYDPEGLVANCGELEEAIR